MPFLKLMKLFIKAVLIPFSILERALTLLAYLSTKSAIVIDLLVTNRLQMPKKLKQKCTFLLVPISQLPGFSKIAETKGGFENIVLPKIVGLSNGGNISVNMPGDYLCKLNHVSFVPYSDFIRDANGNVANEKLMRKEYDVLIPRDRDIIKIKGKIISLAEQKDIIHSKVAFNLMGTFSSNWAHFLAQYYPKLNFLNDLPKLENIDLIVPKNIDLHFKYLIEYELNHYPNINILEVDIDSKIICEKLYHVSIGTLLGDDGYFPTPFAVQISNSTINFWNKKAMELVPTDSNQYRKIFIGRTGCRSIKNYNEVSDYFIDQGFEEIFPHLLNIEDKIKIFSEAKYIVGPWSSGFANSIYSQSGTKLLAFVNSFRYLDTYLSGFNNFKKHEFWFMPGKDDNLKDMNSSYEICLNEIKLFLEENNFFDNQNKVVNKCI